MSAPESAREARATRAPRLLLLLVLGADELDAAARTTSAVLLTSLGDTLARTAVAAGAAWALLLAAEVLVGVMERWARNAIAALVGKRKDDLVWCGAGEIRPDRVIPGTGRLQVDC